MSMLADPKQRKRYHLVPRGKPLYEDKNRFGTKMLEKMGWSMGKGLGAQEDGSKDFIRIRYKNDELGLGFEHRDDQWTQHEQNFNGLLKTLNNEEDPDDSQTKQENGNVSEDEMPTVGFGFSQNSTNEEKKPKVEKLKEKISGISLEERSKQSKARVHYKKFTKGKDLAQYSEKDLANIFGKKAADEQQAAANDFYQQLNNALEKTEEETKSNDKNECLESKDLINTGVSVNDYFKAKMEAIKKRKNGYHNEENISDENINSNEAQKDEEVTKKNKKKKKEKKDQEIDEAVEEITETQNQKESDGQMIYSSVSVNDYFKMKMEALKNKKKAVNNGECNKENTNTSDNVEQDQEVPKKKKKKKHDKELDTTQVNEESTETKKSEEELPVEEEPKIKKKKDKTKKKTQPEAEQPTEQNISSNENEITKKRKHEDSTTPDDNTSSNSAQEIIEIDLTEEPKKKKKKKNKTKEKECNEVIEIDESDSEETPNTAAQDPNNSNEKKQKKKSKKSKESEENSAKDENTSNSNETKIESNLPTKSEKSKKKKKKEVSYSATSVLFNDVNLKELNLDELKNKIKEFNVYQISSFCAEKFRNINLNDFTGSTLPQIEGYSIGPDLQLDVRVIKNDEERITNLWNCVLDKYSHLQKPKKTYRHYVREVIKARKTKQKAPKLYVKTWKRKNAFRSIL